MTVLPPLTVGRFVGSWQFDPWVAAACVLAMATYLLGVRRVRAAGEVWPVFQK